MKKLISILLSFTIMMVIVLGVVVPAFAYESEDGLWTYSLNSGKAVLSAYHGTSNKVTVPANIDGYEAVLGTYLSISAKEVTLEEGFTSVPDQAFRNNRNLEVIKLPSTISVIGERAFDYCSSLKEITLPDSLKIVGDEAFRGCSSLNGIEIPQDIEELGIRSFSGSGISEINIPGTITNIPQEVCSNCGNLKKIKISEGVKSIGRNAFTGCYHWDNNEGRYYTLEEAYLPQSLISITDVAGEPFRTGDNAVVSNLVIYGYKDSTAEDFANTYNYRFVAIIPVTGISVSPTEITIASGKTSQLTCEVIPSNATNKNIKWSSSNNTIATVSSSGLVTGKSEGVAIITVSSKDTGLEATCNVTVHNHSYKATVETAATCSQEGVMRYTCSCGDTYTEPINKTAHKYIGTITTPAGCTTPGITTYKCSNCTANYTEPINPTGHNITSSVSKSPTCIEKGINHFWCTKCDYNYDSEIPANGHNMVSSVSKPATCTEDGTLHNYCTRCTYSYDSVIKADGHKYGAWKTVTPATKTQEGLERRNCTVCEAFETRTIPAEGKVSSATIKISNNPGKRTVSYREGIVLTANVTGQESGDKAVWYVNNQKYCEGNTFEYKELRNNISVKVILVDKSGKEYYDSNDNALTDEETIEVKADFFTKLIAFFKGIFGGNPIIKQ